MPATETFRPFVERMEASGLPYCLTGSIASGLYGEVRYTADIDFVVLLRPTDLAQLRAAFPEQDYYLPPTETLIMETMRSHRGMFNAISHTGIAKADFFIAARDPLHHWGLKHRRRDDLDGVPVWVAPPEYVILRKLEAYREGGQEKHPRDISFMIKCTELDRQFIGINVERLGLHAQWEASLRAAE